MVYNSLKDISRYIKMELKFTDDWFSGNIPHLQEHLSHYVNQQTSMLEIGCYEGRSTVWFLQNILTNENSKIDCVDTFLGSIEHNKEQKENLYQRFHNNIIASGLSSKVTEFCGFSMDFLTKPETRKKEYDIIYIDGDHRAPAVLQDAVLTFDLLKVDGIMIFDDYRGGTNYTSNLEYPFHGVNSFLHVFSEHLKVKHNGYQLLLQKTSNFQ